MERPAACFTREACRKGEHKRYFKITDGLKLGGIRYACVTIRAAKSPNGLRLPVIGERLYRQLSKAAPEHSNVKNQGEIA